VSKTALRFCKFQIGWFPSRCCGETLTSNASFSTLTFGSPSRDTSSQFFSTNTFFSRFAFEIEDNGLEFWLKRYSDQASKLGIRLFHAEFRTNTIELDQAIKSEWARLALFVTPEMFDGRTVVTGIVKNIRRVLQNIQLDSNDSPFHELQGFVETAVEISVSMRLERARFVSHLPLAGDPFLDLLHQIDGVRPREEGYYSIGMALFPLITKQIMFIGSELTAATIFKGRVEIQLSRVGIDFWADGIRIS
jgi:hypothetical protein